MYIYYTHTYSFSKIAGVKSFQHILDIGMLMCVCRCVGVYLCVDVCVRKFYICMYIYYRCKCMYVSSYMYVYTFWCMCVVAICLTYGVATTSRLLKIIGLFCKRDP